MERNKPLFLLGKGTSSSWSESATIIGDPVDVVSSSGVGLLTPGNFVGLVVLGIIPCVVSLGVW